MRNNYKPRSTFICKKQQLQDQKIFSLTIVLGHNIDLGSRVILRSMYSGKLYRCKTITLSRTNIDLGHRGQIVLFFCSMSKVYVSEGNCFVFCSCNSRFWKINIDPEIDFLSFEVYVCLT